jgi:hypothetical protein
MDGWPVWLASASFWPPPTYEEPVLTPAWNADKRSRAEGLLNMALRGLGDSSRERVFRMNLTYCKHRAVSNGEAAGLPGSFWSCGPQHLAGGPLEIISETVEGSLSTRPCEHPTQERMGKTWVPTDCKACGPCRARTTIEESVVRS